MWKWRFEDYCDVFWVFVQSHDFEAGPLHLQIKQNFFISHFQWELNEIKPANAIKTNKFYGSTETYSVAFKFEKKKNKSERNDWSKVVFKGKYF